MLLVTEMLHWISLNSLYVDVSDNFSQSVAVFTSGANFSHIHTPKRTDYNLSQKEEFPN